MSNNILNKVNTFLKYYVNYNYNVNTQLNKFYGIKNSMLYHLFLHHSCASQSFITDICEHIFQQTILIRVKTINHVIYISTAIAVSQRTYY